MPSVRSFQLTKICECVYKMSDCLTFSSLGELPHLCCICSGQQTNMKHAQALCTNTEIKIKSLWLSVSLSPLHFYVQTSALGVLKGEMKTVYFNIYDPLGPCKNICDIVLRQDFFVKQSIKPFPSQVTLLLGGSELFSLSVLRCFFWYQMFFIGGMTAC